MFETFVCGVAMMAFIALGAPIAHATGLAAWQVGATQAMAGLCWMDMARVWGSASDRYGRRRVLLVGLAGFSVGIGGLAVFVGAILRSPIAPSLVFAGLLAGRCVTGMFYSAVPATAAALVADNVPPASRTTAMASIGAANAAGMVTGPGLAGLLGAINLNLPLYFTAVLPLAAFAVLWRRLPIVEQSARSKQRPLGVLDPRVRSPTATTLVAASTMISLQVLVGFIALDRLHNPQAATVRIAGAALALMGAALVLAQLIARRMSLSPRALIRLGGGVAILGLTLIMIAWSPPLLCAAYGITAFGLGWMLPASAAAAANAVEPHEQGATAGTISAAQGFAAVLGPLASTFAYGLNSRLPFAALGCAMMLVMTLGWRQRPT